MKVNISYTDLRFRQFYLHVSIKAFEVFKMLQGNILRTPSPSQKEEGMIFEQVVGIMDGACKEFSR